MDETGQAHLSRDGTFSRRTETLVRDMILGGSLAPGERLNEVAISEALGISRGPLREAIQRLVGEGLVTVVSHRGSFVRTFDRGEVEDLYELRTALESHNVRLVCARASDAELAALERLLHDTGDELAASPDVPYPADRDLHSHLIELSRNAALAKVTRDVQHQIFLARRASARKPERAREALAEHEELVAAIVRRDEDTAAELMRRHLGEASRSAVEALGIETD